jgi:hypothetical protein
MIMPALARIPSAKVVFPLPPWPTKATVLRFSVEKIGMMLFPFL